MAGSCLIAITPVELHFLSGAACAERGLVISVVDYVAIVCVSVAFF